MPETPTAITLVFPPLPEGWVGTPQEFLSWMSENAIIKQASGELLTGEIGSSTPTSDAGLFVNNSTRQISIWNNEREKYLPQLTVPIGAILDWPSQLLTPPENYLFCDGQLLVTEDYPDLYAIIGTVYNRLGSGDTDEEFPDPEGQFRLPDLRGRVAVGASLEQGYMDPRHDHSGRVTLRSVGQYFGAEWPSYKTVTPLNAPTPRYSAALQGAATPAPAFAWNKSTFNGIQPLSLGVRKIIRFQ